jgi:phosphonate C-P lyase system protein PhnH
MAHPGRVSRIETEGVNPMVVIAEALVDHEVTFAVAGDGAELTEAILRQTGSHVAPMDVAQYVFCDSATLEQALAEASDGTWEYPDAGATVVCRVTAVLPHLPAPSLLRPRSGQACEERGNEASRASGTIVASGPGIRDMATVRVEGFSAEARRAFMERNATRPLGLDIIFVTADGALVSFTRYTQLQEG